MSRTRLTTGLLMAVTIGLAPTDSMAGGKEIFVDSKCIGCHSIVKQGIEKKVTNGKKKKGPDLSGAGISHDEAFVTKWLLKEQDKKSVYGDKMVKHKKKFKGSEADLKTLASYLAAQKTKVDVKDEGSDDDDDKD